MNFLKQKSIEELQFRNRRIYKNQSLTTLPIIAQSGRYGAIHKGATVDGAFANYLPPLTTKDAEITYELPILQARSRDLYRNTSICRAIIDQHVKYTLSTGLKLDIQINFKKLGLNDSDAEQLTEQIESMWEAWSMDEYYCDSNRNLNLNTMLELAYKDKLIDGDVFCITNYFMPRECDDMDFYTPLSLNFLDAFYVRTPGVNPSAGYLLFPVTYPQSFYYKSLDDGGLIKSGIEFDKYNLKRAIHYFGVDGEYRKQFIRGKNTHRLIVLNDAIRSTGDQTRGVPLLVAVIKLAKQLDQYLDNEVVSTIISSMFAVNYFSENSDIEIEKNKANANSQLNSLYRSLNPLGNLNQYQSIAQMVPGQINFLGKNDRFETVDPHRPFSNFDPFTQAVFSIISAGANIPVQVALSKFESSYTSARGAIMDFDLTCKKSRNSFNNAINKKIYDSFIYTNYILGKFKKYNFVDLTESELLHELSKAHFLVEPRADIDPTKQIGALKEAIEIGLSTRKKAAHLYNGSNFEKNVAELKKENLKLAESQLAINSSADVQVSELGLLIKELKSIKEDLNDNFKK